MSKADMTFRSPMTTTLHLCYVHHHYAMSSDTSEIYTFRLRGSLAFFGREANGSSSVSSLFGGSVEIMEVLGHRVVYLLGLARLFKLLRSRS